MLDWVQLVGRYVLRPRLYVADKNDPRAGKYLDQKKLSIPSEPKKLSKQPRLIISPTAASLRTFEYQLSQNKWHESSTNSQRRSACGLGLEAGSPISARQQIAIKEVRDGVLLLPGNQFRLVLETTAINFELKSEAEQDVLIESYEGFLHSLPCPLQLLIRVREVDIEQYVSHIGESAQQAGAHLPWSNYRLLPVYSRSCYGQHNLSRRFILLFLQGQKSADFLLAKSSWRLLGTLLCAE